MAQSRREDTSDALRAVPPERNRLGWQRTAGPLPRSDQAPIAVTLAARQAIDAARSAILQGTADAAPSLDSLAERA